MADYVIRRATPADADELIRLRRLMFDAMDVPTDEPTWPETFAGQFLRGDAAGTVAGFLADADGRVVGGGMGSINDWPAGPFLTQGRRGYIYSMATDPDWRGRGIARAVVVALLDWFVAQRVEKVDLHASAEGEPIYRSLGFVNHPYPELRWQAPTPPS